MERTLVIDGVDVGIVGELDGVNLTLHRSIKDPPQVKIKLLKMSKSYQWEITAEGPDADALISLLKDTDQKLRQEYGVEGEQS